MSEWLHTDFDRSILYNLEGKYPFLKELKSKNSVEYKAKNKDEAENICTEVKGFYYCEVEQRRENKKDSKKSEPVFFVKVRKSLKEEDVT